MTVYVIRSDCGRFKIGYTEAATAADRLNSMRTGSPRSLECVATFPGDRSTEKWLHCVFQKSHARGEWFEPSLLMGSLLAYVERFGHVEGWEEAELRPGLWVEHAQTSTKASSFKSLRELVQREHRWTRALKRSHEEPTASTVKTIEARWQPVLLRFEDAVAGEFLDASEICWTGPTQHRGAGVGATAEALRSGRAACWVWLGAFLHDLTRMGGQFLTEVLHRPARLVRLIRSRCPVSWHHLSQALPQSLWLPAHCRLSHDEFLAACQQTARIIAMDWRVQFVWQTGSAQDIRRRAA